jgi:hypothetical protein
MNGLAQRRHGSVTERLSARLDDIEPVVERLLANEAKLIADALTVDARVSSLTQQQGATFNSLAEFCGRGWRGRLRWLVTGR